MPFERLQPTFSIVIASWFKEGQNGKYGENETLWFAKECLEKLVANTPTELYELIVIDNGSTIGQEYFSHPRIDVVMRNKENLGFGPAYNQGFALTRGQYVICLNNDVIVYPGWLDALLEVYTSGLTPPVGVVMPALVKEVKDAREALKIELPDLTQNYDKYGPGAEFGSLWMIKRDLLEQIKQKDGYYFDENFKLGMGEDRDFWRRVRRDGYETYRTHKTRVYHQGNMTISKIENRKQFTETNREYLRKKWAIPEGKSYENPNYPRFN